MRISVVVPVYNSEALLATLVDRLKPVLDAMAEEYELILVNDGSRDKSWDRICQLASEHGWISGINMMRNYGQHSALLCGTRTAQYDTIATMDDDLQHPPEELPKLLVKLAEGWDVVYGTPEQAQHGFLRNLASQFTKIALKTAMGVHAARNASAFRVFRCKLRDAFEDYRGSFVSIDVLLTWATTRFAAVPVRQDARLAGVSQYTVGKLMTHALNMITGFSVLPLQIASVLGFAFTLFGIAVLGYTLLVFVIVGRAVPGFAFLASVIAIFSGVQLFSLGIMGEYMARMHFRIMDRPPYSVRERVGAEKGKGHNPADA
jgi:undecaprenyl-phosphate 4-deoxy-4-formamido-L-arabinose transferase